MRQLPSILILLICLIFISCNQHQLPAIKNPVLLRKDCLIIYQQFSADELPTNAPNFDYQHGLGIREIPKNLWPESINTLNPYMVCAYQGGIQIWICPSGKKNGWAYYVSTNAESMPPAFTASNHFVFKPTSDKGIFEVTQKF